MWENSKTSPANVRLHVQVNVHVIPQLAVIREALSTVVTLERLVIVRSVHTPHVFLHVLHLLSTENTSRLFVVVSHVRFHVDPTLENFSTNFTSRWCF